LKKIISAAVCFAVAMSAAANAVAQTEIYPNKPVRLIVPFPPGGSVDVVARLIAPALGEALGQSVVVENRSGASGNIGTEAVAHARPDGYTLMMHTIPFVVNPHLFSRVSYDPLNDFVPVSLLSSSTSLVVVHPAMPVRTVGELLQLARSKPGALNYAAAGPGTNPHIAGELFNLLGKVDIVAIQYKGGGPAMLATLGGEVSINFPNVAEANPYVISKRIRVLAVTGSKRSATLPDVPTVAEAGLPGYEFVTWHGVLAPKGTPAAIVSLLNQKISAVLRSPETATRFGQIGIDVIASTPEEFAAHLKREFDKWGKVVKERNLRVE
jgi:tripartite-type tricarboxylate transporter receptor subunit TctC